MQTHLPPRSAVFVGRERELGLLHGRLDAAIAGHGGLVLLAGEAGIGKTRLTEELAEAARARCVRVAWGRCWEGEGAPAFWPWIQLLRACLTPAETSRLRPELGIDFALLVPLLPELRERATGDFPHPDPLPRGERIGAVSAQSSVLSPQSSPASPEEARFHLFESVAHVLTVLAEASPLLLILDDLHWADMASLLLLQFLVQQSGLAEMRLLLVGAYRDTDLNRSHPPLLPWPNYDGSEQWSVCSCAASTPPPCRRW